MQPPITKAPPAPATPSAAPNGQGRLPSAEMLLLDYMRRLEKHKVGRRAAHIRLSSLLPHNRREHHIRIAANTFEQLVKMMLGQLFPLSNTDLVFIFKESCLDEVEAAMVKLRFLFSDDPLLADEGSKRQGDFVVWYRLERDYDRLLAFAEKLVADEHERRPQGGKAGGLELGRPPTGESLTPQLLARVEDALSQADLSNLLRRQAICAVVGKSPPQPVFHELFVSIGDLRQTLMPKVNLSSSPWLFQHLTETLDRRVLSLLNKHDDRTLAGDVSINLNVGTLLSPEFLVFDDNVKAGMRGTIVLELQKIDIYSDLGAYLFARDFAHDRGYRICVDGLNYLTMPFIDRDRLGADLFKVIWDPEMAQGKGADQVSEAIRRTNPQRIILCRCDAQDAIECGQAAGITLFQGRHVEGLLVAEQARQKGLYRRRR